MDARRISGIPSDAPLPLVPTRLGRLRARRAVPAVGIARPMEAMPAPSTPILTRPFLLIAAVNTLQSLAFNLFLHVPGFFKDLGADEMRIGLMFGITAVLAIALRPPLGRVMDTVGRRRVIIVGGVLHAATCALYTTVVQVGPRLYAVLLGHTIAEAILFTGLYTQAADLVPMRRRTEGMALYGVSSLITISLGGLLGDAILARGGYYDLFNVALVCAAASLLLSLFVADRPRDESHEPARHFLASVLQRNLLPIWMLGGIFAAALDAHFTFLKTFVMTTGVGSVGLFFFAYSTAGIVGRVFFGWVPDRLGPTRVLLAAVASLAYGLVVVAYASSASQVVCAGALCGLGHGFTLPILSGLVVERARPAERSAAIALFTALFDGGVLIGAPIFGAVIRVAGYPAMFTTAAALLVAGGIVFAVADRS